MVYGYNVFTDELDNLGTKGSSGGKFESGDWSDYLFALNTDVDSNIKNAFGKSINAPATLVIDNNGDPVMI